jgi:hypothetical protein
MEIEMEAKEIDWSSLVIVGGTWVNSADAYIESGLYMDGTAIESDVLEELTYECDLSQMLYERN